MRSYYSSTLVEFLLKDNDEIYHELYRNGSNVTAQQSDAWKEEIQILKKELGQFTSGHIFLEPEIPRFGIRPDVIFIYSGVVFVIEFKVGQVSYLDKDISYCQTYAWCLKHCHEGSHTVPIVPMLFATKAQSVSNTYKQDRYGIFTLLKIRQGILGRTIKCIIPKCGSIQSINAQAWNSSGYRPDYNIIVIAQRFYRERRVPDIKNTNTGDELKINQTINTINDIVVKSKTRSKKSICFVSGVPGSGKTLVGLSVVCDPKINPDDESAVFVSGNESLINVLWAALEEDHKATSAACKQERDKGKIAIKVLIQKLRKFLEEVTGHNEAPKERIVIFDEAQRAWTKEKTNKFFSDNNRSQLDKSEPELIINAMNRHPDWAVIVCLVGSGQEIADGETGLSAWFDAIKSSGWDVYLSNEIVDDVNLSKRYLKTRDGFALHNCDKLHLSTSLRSLRSDKVSSFIENLLDLKIDEAQKIYKGMEYPILLTRNIDAAKQWLRQKKAEGSWHYGIVAASKVPRLRPHGIYVVRGLIDAKSWFLAPLGDIRSSSSLELVADEFIVQGLELDWVCVAWDANFRYVKSKWEYYSFLGSKWCSVRTTSTQQYILNAYRVLLTRARKGMIIFVPEGDSEDSTRECEYYDGTYNYLKKLGLPEIFMSVNPGVLKREQQMHTDQ